MERANGDFKNMLYARLRDVKKECSQWVSELPHVQYSKNTAFHSGINCMPFSVYFGRKPADLVADYSILTRVARGPTFYYGPRALRAKHNFAGLAGRAQHTMIMTDLKCFLLSRL